MTPGTIEVLTPVAAVARRRFEPALRLPDLNGKVLGLLDNGKPNFGIFLARVEELLTRRLHLKGVVRVRKEGGIGVALPIPGDMLDSLSGCDFVVNGMAD
ncbi:MAG: hypothetical protein HYX96_06005 [Chloroflexi bacterium]|nr:hypothetical protein [Chloroflexota bacterium]